MTSRKCTAALAAVTLLAGFLVAGCSRSPDEISAVYVAPLEYRSYDCDQIEREMQRVSRQAREVTGHQRDEAEGDAVAMGVGLFVFWPALFFLAGEDKEDELAQLKGEMEALEAAAIEKDCEM